MSTFEMYRRPASLSWGQRALMALSLMLAVSLPLSALAAPGAGKLELKSEAFHEVEQTGKDGKKTKKLEALARAVPGQEVIYVITYRNTGTQPVEDIKIDNPVPKGLVYQAGTAQGAGTKIEFSVDGGAHYGAMETLSAYSATGQSHAAGGADVTHIRWILTTPLKPAGEGSVTFRAVLP